ncbi:ABC transporter permease [Arcanobacterium haemolyticum]|nr:ABC transporter permease [Arcanobacterium haemolyticum]
MTWLLLNWQMVVALTGEHLALTLPAIALSALIALPIGRYAYTHPPVGGTLLSFTTLLYAIPALPLLVIIPSLFGTQLRSPATMIIALTIYGVALMVRSSADSFASIDPTTLNAATALGFSPRSRLWQVELPLALPVMVAGLRVVAVSTVSLVTIGSLVGIRSLGTLLTDGFQRGIVGEVLTGICATILVALILDGFLVMIRYAVTPWARRKTIQPSPSVRESHHAPTAESAERGVAQ